MPSTQKLDFNLLDTLINILGFFVIDNDKLITVAICSRHYMADKARLLLASVLGSPTLHGNTR